MNVKPEKININFSYTVNGKLLDTTLVASGTVTHANGMGELNTGAASSSSAELVSSNVIFMSPSFQTNVVFGCAFDEFTTGLNQLVGIGDSVYGFYVGGNGATFGIQSIVNSSVTNALQADFNGPFKTSDFASQFDPTKGNLYRLRLSKAGFGFIYFDVLDDLRDEWITMHVIENPSSLNSPSYNVKAHRLRMLAENTTNSTAKTLKVSTIMAYVDGDIIDLPTPIVFSNFNNSTSTTVFHLRLKSTFHGVDNRALVKLKRCVFWGLADRNIYIYKNFPITGTPVWSDVDTNNSVCEISTAGTITVPGPGEIIIGLGDAFAGTAMHDFEDDFLLSRGDIYTVQALGSSNRGGSLVWWEYH